MKLEDMFSTFKNSADKTIGEVFLYGPIARGGFWESDENSCKNFLDQIRELEKTCDEIHLRINSEGGEVFEGQAIYSALKKCTKPTIAFIDGLAASIATVITCGCDKVVCAENGLYMVHSPLCSVSGNSHDMKEMARTLDKIEEAIIESYVSKCGDKCSRDEIKDFLAGENNDGQGTWMTAKEAKKYGFVDEVGQELAIAAQIDDMSDVIINDTHMDLSGYQNLDKVRKMFENTNVDNKTTQEIEMSEKEKLGSIIDEIAAKCKALFIKDEIEPQTEIVDSQNEELEQPQDESLENPVQEQDAKVQDEITQEEPVAKTEADAEVKVESAKITEPKQEEPEIENAEEKPKEVVENEVEEPIEPDSEAEDSAIIPEVENSVDLVSKVAALEAELKKVKADKAIQEAKAKLSKEVQNKFKGVPGKLEDKVNMIYDIQNSSLTNETQEFILNGLSQLSEQNLKDCEELGSDGQEEPIDKNDTIAQAKALAEKEGISENQAVAVLKGGMTLSKAKKSKNK